jgi:hypothetical protein
MMIYLGVPFFYHHNPEFINRNESRQVHVYGSQICKLIKDPNHWLDDAHISILIRWMLRDYGHPVLDQFTYIPLEISTVFHNFVNKSVSMTTLARALHKFCKEVYQTMYKQYVFYFENQGNYHWIVHVAINPFAALNRVLFPKESPKFQFGYFTYDPFDNPNMEKRSTGAMFLPSIIIHLECNVLLQGPGHSWING